MKPDSTLRSFLLLAGSSLLAISYSHAADGTWNVDTNGTWSTAGNWTPGIADGSGFTANFTNNITADRTVSLDTDRTLTNVVFGDSDTSTAGSWILDNNGVGTNNLILAGTTPTITVNALGTGKTATISAIIEGSAGLTKAGAGTLVLTGANTFTGGITISASSGTLRATRNATSSINAISTGAVSIGAGSTLLIDIAKTANTADAIGNTFSGDGNLTLNFASGTTARTTSIAVANLSGVNGTLRLSSAGTTADKLATTGTFNASSTSLIIDSGNTYFNNSAGTATFKDITVSGTGNNENFGAIRLANSAKIAGNITLAGSTSITSGNTSGLISGNITSGAAGTQTLSMGINGKATGSGTISGIIGGGTGTIALTTDQGGTVLTLSNANTYTGATTITRGVLILGNSLAMQNSALNTTGSIAGAGTSGLRTTATTLTLGGLTGNKNFAAAGGVFSTTSGGYGSVTALTLNPGTGASYNYDGAIENGAAGMNLTKTGAGTQTLAGTNTYSGATAINAGTLAVTGTGSINNTSAINVAAGGTLRYNSSTALTVAPTLAGAGTSNRAVLGGTGPINVAVTLDNLGDVLAPGNSPGIQNYTVGQTWASFSYDWEVNDFTGTTAGTDFDQIGITGTLNLTGGSGSYILNLLGLTAGDVAGLVPNFGEINRSWTILTSTGITGFNPVNWTINTTGFTDPDTGTWALAQSGNNLVLSYTAVPEPGAALLGGLGMLMLLRRRRR